MDSIEALERRVGVGVLGDVQMSSEVLELPA